MYENVYDLTSAKKACSNASATSHAPGALKPLDEFARDPRKTLGVSSHCRDCQNEARKARYRRDNESGRKQREYRQWREAAIEIYGGQCEGCGDVRDLEFDHVNADGNEHRKAEGAKAMLRRIAETGKRITDYELRLLCADCHDFVTNGVSQRSLALLLARSRDWPSLAVLAVLPPPRASQLDPAWLTPSQARQVRLTKAARASRAGSRSGPEAPRVAS